MMRLRTALLDPRTPSDAMFIRDAVIVCEGGRLEFAGDVREFEAQGGDVASLERVGGVVIPPMLDVHTHVPQWPIRGRFLEGVEGDPPGGRLLAGLARNVFPAEERFASEEIAAAVTEAFAADALASGVVGGCVFVTSHPRAARLALERLGDAWLIGPVLMNQSCPAGLARQWEEVGEEIEALAAKWGGRVVPADRFALACDTPLRRAGVKLAERHDLRMQTHLAEQLAEVALVRERYPEAAGYADVYRRDGLLSRRPILAHCVHLAAEEWRMLADHGASVAHCPTSNTLLGSGIMPLAEAREAEAAGAALAIATDVGASPTTSLLAEARQFVLVHSAGEGDEDGTRDGGGGGGPTAVEALYRVTHAPAAMLGMADRFAGLESGRPASFLLLDALPAGTAEETAGRVIGWQTPGEAVGRSLESLRTGAPTDEAMTTLRRDFHEAAQRVARVRRVILDGRTVLRQGPATCRIW